MKNDADSRSIICLGVMAVSLVLLATNTDASTFVWGLFVVMLGASTFGLLYYQRQKRSQKAAEPLRGAVLDFLKRFGIIGGALVVIWLLLMWARSGAVSPESASKFASLLTYLFLGSIGSMAIFACGGAIWVWVTAFKKSGFGYGMACMLIPGYVWFYALKHRDARELNGTAWSLWKICFPIVFLGFWVLAFKALPS